MMSTVQKPCLQVEVDTVYNNLVKIANKGKAIISYIFVITTYKQTAYSQTSARARTHLNTYTHQLDVVTELTTN